MSKRTEMPVWLRQLRVYMLISLCTASAWILVYFFITEIILPERTCSDFGGNQGLAQHALNAHPNRYANLDRDKDTVACDSLLKQH